jgi:hypothetical protein
MEKKIVIFEEKLQKETQIKQRENEHLQDIVTTLREELEKKDPANENAGKRKRSNRRKRS